MDEYRSSALRLELSSLGATARVAVEREAMRLSSERFEDKEDAFVLPSERRRRILGRLELDFALRSCTTSAGRESVDSVKAFIFAAMHSLSWRYL